MARRTKKQKQIDKLVKLAERLGLQPVDLDELVHDLAQELGLDRLNALEDPADQDGHISEQESTASAINNGGLDSQIEFLMEHNGQEVVEQLIHTTAQELAQGD